MIEKILIHVHMWYTLCSWQLGSKGEVVEVLEKEKELIWGTRLWVSVLSDPEGPSPVPNPWSQLAFVA
jgi:hypothetical protein